jgi:hypothetical protein
MSAAAGGRISRQKAVDLCRERHRLALLGRLRTKLVCLRTKTANGAAR